MSAIFQYLWVLLICVNVLNALLFRQRSKKLIEEQPALKKGYGHIFKGLLIVGSLPWAIIGLGVLSGRVRSMADFFNPRTLKPIVLFWHGTVIMLWILSIRWIFLKNGAVFLEKHPGVVRIARIKGPARDLTKNQIKLFVAVAILAGVTGMTMMWIGHAPVLSAK